MLSKLFAFIILILLLPVMFIIVFIIVVEDGMPFVHFQKRIGYKNKTFMIFKFRTMKKNCPIVPTDLLNGDKFLLKSGKILRKLSLDEIPNLFNIIRGEMKFIGPRPAILSQKKLIALRSKAGIHNLFPGISGLAQINGRDNLNDIEKVYYDKKYLYNKSLFLDFKIFVLTFIKIFKFDYIKH